MEQFDENRYFSAYKGVRNKFRNYDSLALIDGCIRYLHHPTPDQLQQLQKQPWLVLLLIKWILIDEQSFFHGKKFPTDHEIHELLQLVHDLGSSIRLPSQFDHHVLFFRSIAYQQFIYQREFALSYLSRQIALFSELESNHLIQTQFRQITGLDIGRFLELSFVLLVRFLGQTNHSISVDWFNSVESGYTPQEIQSFLSALSKPLDEIRSILVAQNNGRRPASEYYEQTPFIEYPLIKAGTEYICIDHNILYRRLEHFIYDKLRSWDAGKFMDKFGRIFESHVGRAIQHTGLPFSSEDYLRKIWGHNDSLIDFVITDGEANVFVDAKAVEMSRRGKVTHLADIVQDITEISILKAIEQAHDVMTRMRDIIVPNSPLQSKNSNYLIVVTFKELYVGNGRTFYEAIAKNKIDEIYSKYSETIALEDMYFLTIDEFEVFAEAIRNGSIGLVEGIEKAKADDANPLTRKFDFSLHIANWNFKNDIPKYLHDRSDALFNKLERTIQPS